MPLTDRQLSKVPTNPSSCQQARVTQIELPPHTILPSDGCKHHKSLFAIIIIFVIKTRTLATSSTRQYKTAMTVTWYRDTGRQ